MTIIKIEFQDFRSYQKANFKFGLGLNLIIGPNVVGKTNLLEAIFLLATGKSFRAGVEREMIRSGVELARVVGEISDTQRDHREHRDSVSLVNSVPSVIGEVSEIGSQAQENTEKLELVLTTGEVGGQRVAKKRYLVNGVARRQMDFVGNLRAVLFRPEDLEIITGSPSGRRRFMDTILEMTDREYRRANLSYQKGLRQRNKLLEQIREEGKPRSVLYFWDKLIIENGQMINGKRRNLIKFMNRELVKLGSPGDDGRDGEPGSSARIEYDESLISEKRLEQYARQEVAAGMTLVGPHRDDFVVAQISPSTSLRTSTDLKRISTDSEITKYANNQMNTNKIQGRDLAIYGSRGEQRLAVLNIKLAELEFVVEVTGDRPVLLLDDIFSELDREHREQVLAVVQKQQTLITTTDASFLDKKALESARIVELSLP